MNWQKKPVLGQKGLRLCITFGLFCILLFVFGQLNTGFLSADSVNSLLRESAIVGIMAVGMSFVIITGGIDLSVGSNMALTAMICANLLRYSKVPMIPAVALSLLAATACGCLNGIAITKLKLPDFIVTLAAMNIYRGLTKIISRNDLDSLNNSMIQNQAFKALGGKVASVYLVVWVFLILAVVGHLILNHTKTGLYTFAIGSNSRSATLSGISFSGVKIFAYTITGFLAVVAGVMICARMMTATTVTGEGMEFNVIAAVVLGVTSLAGGRGSIVGSFIGALMITMISSGITQMGLSSCYQYIIKGVIILIAMIFDGWFFRRFAARPSDGGASEMAARTEKEG